MGLVGCGQADSTLSREAGRSDGTFDGAAPPVGPDGPGEGSGTRPAPGTLTAGVWDDNRNFDHFTDFLTENAGQRGAPPFTDAEREAANDRFAGERAANARLDIAFVIDTTGSMGDEIRYLQSEIDDIATRVIATHPGAEARWALILYRDEGDEYVVREFDFDANVGTFQARLAAQSAGGGGDYPEASHAALAAMNQLRWRAGDDVARLAFWVADAPHHAQHAEALATAVRAAARADVHLYPVASSGIDLLTELTMRGAAQLTGGRYLFLTDDSGVGGSHLEPSIPCYFVTLLSHAMLRVIEIEMTGVYREPEPTQVIRAGGDPRDGACELEGGKVVEIF